MQNKKLDDTIEMLKGKLEQSAAKTAAKSIEKWETTLESAEWRGAKTIHEDLARLRKHLEGDNLDGAKIGELMIKLGESTSRAAGHEETKGIEKVEQLGHALVAAGEKLGGKRSENSQSDTTGGTTGSTSTGSTSTSSAKSSSSKPSSSKTDSGKSTGGKSGGSKSTSGKSDTAKSSGSKSSSKKSA